MYVTHFNGKRSVAVMTLDIIEIGGKYVSIC